MKKIIFALICCAVLFTSISAMAATFCDGWEEGYKAGYCYKRPNCSEPLVPVCPTPQTGKNTYKDGYDLGFPSGLNSWRLLNTLPSYNQPFASGRFYYLASRQNMIFSL
jgi:hypothetical protein